MSSTLNPDVVERALAEYGLAATRWQIEQLLIYQRLLLEWNEKINLTAIRDPLEVIYRHFCESMFAAKLLPLDKGRLADIGSGGGFPGLPLKIVHPELQVFLVESNVKKATFLAELVRDLNLAGVRVLVSRYEELSEEVIPLDDVCARALGEYQKLLEWAHSISAARVLLWIGGTDLESVRRNQTWSWREPVAIPHSLRRYILIGERKS